VKTIEANDGSLVASSKVPASVVVTSRAAEIGDLALAATTVTAAAYRCFQPRRVADYQTVMNQAKAIAAVVAGSWDEGGASGDSYAAGSDSEYPYQYAEVYGKKPLAADTACNYLFHNHPNTTTPDGNSPLSNDELAQLFARELRSTLTLFDGWSALGTYYGNAPSETTGPDNLRNGQVTFRTYADNLLGVDWTSGYHCHRDTIGVVARWYPSPRVRDTNRAPDMVRVKVGNNIRGLAPSAL
jgi:hypothetical protein